MIYITKQTKRIQIINCLVQLQAVEPGPSSSTVTSLLSQITRKSNHKWTNKRTILRTILSLSSFVCPLVVRFLCDLWKQWGHGPLCMHQYGLLLEAFRGTWFVHMLNCSESVWRARNITVFNCSFWSNKYILSEQKAFLQKHKISQTFWTIMYIDI